MNIIKLHFFEKVVCDGVDSTTFFDMIDASKLKQGITELLDAFGHYNNYHQQHRLRLINAEEEEIQLSARKSANDFPVLCKHQILCCLPLYMQ
jgi:hypothetical protein